MDECHGEQTILARVRSECKRIGLSENAFLGAIAARRKGLARQNYSQPVWGQFPHPHGELERAEPGPFQPQLSRELSPQASGKFESALTDCGERPISYRTLLGTTGFPVSLSGTTCSTALCSSPRSLATGGRRDRMQLRELTRQPAPRGRRCAPSSFRPQGHPSATGGRKQEERGSGTLGCGWGGWILALGK